MNSWQELEEFIYDQRSVKDNSLSAESIIEIGLMHKQLPQGLRSWNRLAAAINWDGTGQSLRSFINRNTILISKKETKIEMAKDNKLENFAEEYKEKVQVRDTWNAYRRTLREDARIDSLKNTITDAAKALPTLPKVEKASYKGTETEAILMLSDLHIGVLCDNFYNKYDSNIAALRLGKLATQTIKYCKQNKVKTLNVVNLGDLIQGLIHVTARIEEEMEVIEQVMTASEMLANFLDLLQEAAPEVVYRSCTDNHSRTIANKDEAIEKENFGRLIDWYVEARCKNTSVKFVYDNLDPSLGLFELANGKKVVFTHGHLDNINTAFQHFIGATKTFIDYALLGHYHDSKMKGFQDFKVFINGSIVGTEQYALSKRLFSSPSQTLLVFDGETIVNHIIDLK